VIRRCFIWLIFYGVGLESKEAIAKIKCSVNGFYGGNDARVDATIPNTAELMKEAGKSYEPITCEGTGQGMRPIVGLYDYSWTGVAQRGGCPTNDLVFAGAAH